eukprot:TRINITY_DN18636_c0_g1_i1.p1 TRINITY_DN18636_c0_g1~~TRINITY_DN18636_c0_g1_i1.p1  ORF type:complete len:314 (-),score=62.62 TRINITY_DN18636_c0_g1_i1:78-1019(-)
MQAFLTLFTLVAALCLTTSERYGSQKKHLAPSQIKTSNAGESWYGNAGEDPIWCFTQIEEGACDKKPIVKKTCPNICAVFGTLFGMTADKPMCARMVPEFTERLTEKDFCADVLEKQCPRTCRELSLAIFQNRRVEPVTTKKRKRETRTVPGKGGEAQKANQAAPKKLTKSWPPQPEAPAEQRKATEANQASAKKLTKTWPPPKEVAGEQGKTTEVKRSSKQKARPEAIAVDDSQMPETLEETPQTPQFGSFADDDDEGLEAMEEGQVSEAPDVEQMPPPSFVRSEQRAPSQDSDPDSPQSRPLKRQKSLQKK